MTDFSVAMTTARMQIVQLRLQGSTLAATVQQGMLTHSQAAALVRDAAGFLGAPTNNLETERLYAEALAEVARDLDKAHP